MCFILDHRAGRQRTRVVIQLRAMAKVPSRSALLARELLGRIARGDLRPGDPIDLRELGRQHGVSRTVVREALADLGGKGLVVARPKVGTTVAPLHQWQLLDPTFVAVAIDDRGSPAMRRDALALRRVIEPAMAAAAALDASTAARAEVLASVRALADAVGRRNPERIAAADTALHEAIARACPSHLLRSIDHALVPVRALNRAQLLAGLVPGAEPPAAVLHLLALQTRLAGAIARREDARAAHWAREIVAAAPLQAPPPARPAVAVGTPADPFDVTAPLDDDAVVWPATVTLAPDTTPLAVPRRGHIEPAAATH